ncbi:hypothetical protein KQ247_19325 [Ruegeria pomeroyi]|nr:hypothetical protein [Ruegeria pomeroyi]NVK96941.1 hypothetical protein [Ruegeria pomeroyi]NVL02368.1 hypothetical protein [Ruegeria pomeroyi]QWV08922.1 hypothetical protein KQ247_19325 [Ruegeria pomeroyi]HCE69879.1 hypothetical protein [Ruegeria sp.]
MRVLIPTLAATVILTGCGPLSIYYREGVSVTRQQSDTLDCEVKALRDAPVANKVQQSPPIFYPGRTVCNAAGQCYTTPGSWAPGSVYTVDVNSGLRARVEQQCMAAKGYAPVELPRCREAVAAQVQPVRGAKLPALGPTSCVVTYQDGSFQVVTPRPAG